MYFKDKIHQLHILKNILNVYVPTTNVGTCCKIDKVIKNKFGPL